MKKTMSKKTKNLVLSALFLAIAYVLPFLTGQIPEIGNMLCPMHIPVLLCGFICGWYWGGAVGFIAPLFRSLTLGAPVLFPRAVCMALELCTYGAIAGLMHKALPKKKPDVYLSLTVSMMAGRLVWGGAMYAFTAVQKGSFGLLAFVSGAFTNAIPGIIIQLVLIPVIVMLLESRPDTSEH